MDILYGNPIILEYKSTFTKSLLKAVSAFANFHDGRIIIGINDDKTLIGVDNPEELRLNIENSINDNLEPCPYYEISTKTIDDKTILIISVYKGDNTPYTVNNKAYKRSDTATVQVDKFLYQNLILAGRNKGFDGLASSVQELYFNYLESKMRKILGINSLSEDLLISLGLIENRKYNNAAALFSDDNPVDSSVIQMIAYNDRTVLGIKDRVESKNTSILKQFDECLDFYKKHINISEIIDGAYRKTVEEVPLVAYRESIANLLVHRDYMKNVDSRIEIFSDRIEIVSPGGLPIGILEDEYLEGRISIPRNRIIADIFLRLKIIEKLGTGIRRIKEYYREYDTKPEFIITENSITVILPRINKEIKKVNEINLDRLNSNELLIYYIIKDNGKINRKDIENKVDLKKSQILQIINNLREYNLVIKTGQGINTEYMIK
ncbi:ATP-dependent DNA helicase RecG [Acetoanaerobium pronyense]|uniref:ATP-dependent DNA helicase RecG n=1 Tax=Acetoanaerobium pronyense TaxID=1482736 RepID=A0ABS4KLU1_9FIRM|nr:RNA-binding domain-containing protein [Acetoanaerobium pronyense]MBP2028754.1 ATP-dependent DNA helicase RecG [Acetoanaerobium pronyense]